MHPKVSVIVPVFKVEKFLDRCIQSIIKQTLKDIEIILIDDGSPDKCPLICDEYAKQDNRIHVIHQKNQGLGMARNTGLQYANGEFIAFVDSDDFIDEKMYEHLYHTAKENSLDVCFCGYQYYKDKAHINKRYEINKFVIIENANDIKTFLFNMVGPLPNYKQDTQFFPSVWRAIYSTEILKIHDIVFQRKSRGEDLMFNISYLSNSKRIGLLPAYYYNYYVNANSITHTYSWKDYTETIDSLYQTKDLLERLFPEKQYYIHLQRYIFLILRISISLFATQKYNSLKKKYDIINQCLKEPIFNLLFTNYPYKKMNLIRRLFYIAAKDKRIISLIFYVYIAKFINKI